jgi:hypothetical protein
MVVTGHRWWTLGLWLFVAGCSSEKGPSHSGSTGGVGPTASSGDGSDFAKAFCDAARSCCVKEQMDVSGLDDCEAAALVQLNLLAALQRGTAKAVEPAYSKCVQGLRALGDSCVAMAEWGSCGDAFQGTAGEGEPCHKSVDCIRGEAPVACIKQQPDSSAASPELGVCRKMVAAKLGEPCLMSGDAHFSGVTYTSPDEAPPLGVCAAEDGLYCAFSVPACQARGALNAPCTSHDSCQLGLGCIDNTCQTPQAEGGACGTSDDCMSGALCQNHVCAVPKFGTGDLCEGDLD